MINLLKGIIVGIGGVTPGLSGSVLLVIFGLYQKTINAIGTIFKDLKKNLKFLIPLFIGIGIGAVLFSKIVTFLFETCGMFTRFTFFGLVLGTVPLLYREMKKEGYKKKYYIIVALAFFLGVFIFFFNGNLFPNITNPTLIQSIILGVAYAASSIIPGVDSAAILSSLGLYEVWLGALDALNLSILIPAAFGLGIGVLVISMIMNLLLSKCYTATFSVIFGLFLTVVPSVLDGSCVLGFNATSVVSIVLVIIGFGISYFFGDFEKNKEKIKQKLLKK